MSDIIKLELSREQASALIKATEEKLRTLNETKAEIEKLIENEKELLDTLINGIAIPAPVPPKPARYNKEWSWAEKAKYILLRKQVVMTLNQILAAAEKYQPDLREDAEELTKTRSNLSGQLALSKQFKRTRIGEEKTRFYYGLSHWFDDAGDVLEEYKPETEE